MKAILLAAALALGLAGCLSTSGGSTTVSAQSAYVSINAFNALKTAATAYDSLPACGAAGASVACRNPAAVKQIDAAVRTGTTARNQVMAALETACGLPAVTGATPLAACGPISITPYQALEATIATLQSAYATYSITAPATPSN